MNRDQVLIEIIRSYRELIDKRYQFKSLEKNFDLPTSITKEQITAIRSYFLSYVYPDSDKRTALNEAFESLNNYLKNPSKLLQLVIDSVGLVFKFGRHLPKIFNSGLKAMGSFKAASNFENQLVDQAVKANLVPPYDQATLYQLIREIPRAEVDQFIEGTRSLFEILHDSEQVEKIIEIIHYLLKKMSKQPNVYSTQEIAGLSLGLELIEKGFTLFQSLGKTNQSILIDFIVEVEVKTLNGIYD